MNIYKKVLLCLALASLVLAQTNFKNTCQKNSMLPLLATGVINLNPLDTYNAGANKGFYQDLSSAQFQTTDVLGYGFALSGFQAGCGQSYYTLVIDKVDF
jgi:EamA domain-containing membrane protein RarD